MISENTKTSKPHVLIPKVSDQVDFITGKNLIFQIVAYIIHANT